MYWFIESRCCIFVPFADFSQTLECIEHVHQVFWFIYINHMYHVYIIYIHIYFFFNLATVVDFSHFAVAASSTLHVFLKGRPLNTPSQNAPYTSQRHQLQDAQFYCRRLLQMLTKFYIITFFFKCYFCFPWRLTSTVHCHWLTKKSCTSPISIKCVSTLR